MRDAIQLSAAAMTEEQRPHVENYVDYVRKIQGLADMLCDGRTFEYEVRLNTRILDCWGTVDALILAGNTAWIIDLKTGRELIPPNNNVQLLTYAVGVLSHYPGVDTFNLVICQDNNAESPVTEWTCNRAAVLAHRTHIRSVIRTPERLQMGGWCGWCDRRSTCQLHQAATSQVFDEALAASPTAGRLPATPTERERAVAVLTPTQRAFILAHRDSIEKYMAAVAQECLRDPPPGWKVVAGGTRTRWIDDAGAIRGLAGHGIQPRVQPPTISAARTALCNAGGPGLADAVLARLTETPPGRPTLVPEADLRLALDRAAVFAALDEPQPVVEGGG